MLTTAELCKYAGISRQTFTRWRAMGLIPEPEHKTSHGRGVRNYYNDNAREAIDRVKHYRGKGWSFPAIVAAMTEK